MKKVGDERAVGQLRLVETSLEKLTSLIDDLLDATALETGQFRLEKAAFPVDALVHEIVEAVQITMKQHTVVVEGTTRRLGYGDRERTGQVLINLLVNAGKYAEASPIIRVVVSEGEESISVRVQDFGPGISRTQQADIFHHLLRLRGPGQRKTSGLGLGLYIASEIVMRQGGRIGVESEEGQGATFFFTIPYAPLPESR
jgi:signal transduction histidine kinase